MSESYWYCPSCKKELDGCHVTYQELCEYCGTAVLVVPETISQKRIEELIKADADDQIIILPCKIGDTILLDTEIMGCSFGKMPFKIIEVLFSAKGDFGGATQERTVSLEDVRESLERIRAYA